MRPSERSLPPSCNNTTWKSPFLARFHCSTSSASTTNLMVMYSWGAITGRRSESYASNLEYCSSQRLELGMIEPTPRRMMRTNWIWGGRGHSTSQEPFSDWLTPWIRISWPHSIVSTNTVMCLSPCYSVDDIINPSTRVAHLNLVQISSTPPPRLLTIVAIFSFPTVIGIQRTQFSCSNQFL